MQTKILIITILITLAQFPRAHFNKRPLWVDEIKGLEVVRTYHDIGYVNGVIEHRGREWFTTTIDYLFGLDGKQARIPVIIFSSLAIAIPFIIIRNIYHAMLIAIMLAFAPLFSFWGTLARPYAIGMFFCLLGYRWPAFYIPALLATPFSVSGLNWLKLKQRWPLYTILILLAFGWYNILKLGNYSHFNWEFLINAKRLWVIPAAVLLLHIADNTTIQGLRQLYQRLVKRARS